MSAAPSPTTQCPHEYQWTGSGRHRHSSGYNPTFRCTREEGHDGPHACERQPRAELAPVLVAELPARVTPPNTPAALTDATRDLVIRERSRFGVVVTRPLPANELEARKELQQMKAAMRSSLARHYFARRLAGVDP